MTKFNVGSTVYWLDEKEICMRSGIVDCFEAPFYVSVSQRGTTEKRRLWAGNVKNTELEIIPIIRSRAGLLVGIVEDLDTKLFHYKDQLNRLTNLYNSMEVVKPKKEVFTVPHNDPDYIVDDAARAAWDELEALGAPLLVPSLNWGGHFALSTEMKSSQEWLCFLYDITPNDWVFGCCPRLDEILKEHGLFLEQVNGGVGAVYTI